MKFRKQASVIVQKDAFRKPTYNASHLGIKLSGVFPTPNAAEVSIWTQKTWRANGGAADVHVFPLFARRAHKHNRNSAIKAVTHMYRGCLIILNLGANILTVEICNTEEHCVAHFKVRRKDKYTGNGGVGRRWMSLWWTLKGVVGGCEEGAGWLVLF